MERLYYLTVDGGGTKLHSLLFDDTLRPVGCGVGGAINPNFMAMEQVSRSMEESIDKALASLGGKGNLSIESVWISVAGPKDLYEKLLRQRCEVQSFYSMSEGETAIYSAGLDTGVLVLCGTGSILYHIQNGKRVASLGGWGSPFGDEGSGSDIGCMAMQAALRSHDGWGEKTLLEAGLCQFFGGSTIREAMAAFWQRKDTRSAMASVCRLVSQCADQGDVTAQGILSEAGRKVARQAMAFLQREGLPPDSPVVLAGGAWKTGGFMVGSFARTLASRYPQAKVILPAFDPVMGPVVRRAMEEGPLTPERWRELTEWYPQFVLKWPDFSAACAPAAAPVEAKRYGAR